VRGSDDDTNLMQLPVSQNRARRMHSNLELLRVGIDEVLPAKVVSSKRKTVLPQGEREQRKERDTQCELQTCNSASVLSTTYP